MPLVKKVSSPLVLDWTFGGYRQKWRSFKGLMCGLRSGTIIGIRFPEGVQESDVRSAIGSLSDPMGTHNRGPRKGERIPVKSTAKFSIKRDGSDKQLFWIIKD